MATAVAIAIGATGCQVATKNEDRAAIKQEEQAAKIAMKINGEEITNGEYTNMYIRVANFYAQLGMDLTQPAEIENLKTAVHDEVLKKELVLQNAKKEGLDKLTEEEQSEIDTEYDKFFDDNLNLFKDQVTQQNPDVTEDDEITKRATEMLDTEMKKAGMTKENVKQDMVDEKVFDKMYNKVRDAVEISDDEVKTYYDEKLKEQEAAIKDDAAAFEQFDGQGLSVVAPEGYFYVKHILISKAESESAEELTQVQTELQQNYTELGKLNAEDKIKNAAEITALEIKIKEQETKIADLEKIAYAPALERANEAIQKLKAGADFDALIEEYGEDPGMQNEPTKTKGYLMSKDNQQFVKEFVDGAMSLVSVGDYSQTPVKSDFGYHIIKKVSLVTPGVKSLDEVREALKEAALEEKKAKEWDDTMTKWIDDAKVEEFEENMVVDLTQ